MTEVAAVRTAPEARSRRAALTRTSGAGQLSLAMTVSGVLAYAFHILAARALGPDAYGQVAQKAQDVYGQTAQKAQELIDAGKETVAAKREQLQAAIDAGKDAYAEEKDRAKAGAGKSLGTGGGAAPGNA